MLPRNRLHQFRGDGHGNGSLLALRNMHVKVERSQTIQSCARMINRYKLPILNGPRGML